MRPWINQSNLSIFFMGLIMSSKPDFPRPNSNQNQHHQLSLAAAEDKTNVGYYINGHRQ
jgi:hypothetical protein